MKKTIITLAFLLSFLLAACKVEVCWTKEPLGYHPGIPGQSWLVCHTAYDDGKAGKTYRYVVR